MKSGVAPGTPVTAGSVTFYSGEVALGTVPMTTQNAAGVTPGTATLDTRELVPDTK